MLKTWLNTTVSNFEIKTHEQVISAIQTSTRLNITKLYYEVKNLKNTIYSLEKHKLFLLELFLPYGVSIKQIFLYKIYLEYLNKSYKFLRILYNLPIRKTRTHALSKKKKWIHTLSVTYCIKTTPLFKTLKLPKSKIQVLFFCEFINSLWFFNWWKDWSSSQKTRIKSTTKNPFIKWKYDVVGLLQGRIVLFLNKKKKTKHNRKKAVLLKNTYNIGFGYGFSITYLKKIIASLQNK